MHSYHDGHFTSISTWRMWKVNAEIQVFGKEFHKHINLDYAKVKFLSCIIYIYIYKTKKTPKI